MLNIEYLFYNAYLFFRNVHDYLFGLDPFFTTILFWFKVFSASFTILLSAGIVYNILKTLDLRKKELAEFVKIAVETSLVERSSRWDKIKTYSASNNSSDWRRAVIEADNLLEEIIKTIGYEGTTFGDRLMQIKPVQLRSLDELWAAHKLRNRIVHGGDKHNLTKEQTETAIGFFEKVLKELEYI